MFVQKIEEDKQPILRVYVPNSSLNQYSTVNKATPRSTKKAAQSQRIMGFHIWDLRGAAPLLFDTEPILRVMECVTAGACVCGEP